MKHILSAVCLLFTALLVLRCANEVAPTGGPKDTTPPTVVKAVPENNSINFDGKRIELTFDEYITLENARQNVLISPPLSEKPDFKLRNKTVIVKFKAPLEPNTTYTINFGSAIKDLHEGNQFENYIYSFSTGDHLDTLAIGGKVVNAEDKKPVENVYVSLYSSDQENLDSLPMIAAPNFIAKTDKEGNFLVSGLADKTYFVFALKDVNSNLYFDLPNEEVAFLDTLVPATCLPVESKAQAQDSTSIDTLLISDTISVALADTLIHDTISFTLTDSLAAIRHDSLAESLHDTLLITMEDTIPPKVFDPNALHLTLYMFTEPDSTQMLLEKKLIEKGLLRFVFRYPAKDAVVMTPEMLPDTFNLIAVNSPEFDTVRWFFTPNVKDSLWVQVKYDTVINDSSHYSLKFKDKNARNKKQPESLKITNNLIGQGGLIAGEDLILKFSEPVVAYQMRDSAVFKRDTVVSYNTLAFEQADEHGMQYKLVADIVPDAKYSFELPDSVFFGIRGHVNAKLKVDFHVLGDDEYGNIYITVAPPEGMRQVVVQLTNESGKILKQQTITEQEEVMFEHLVPAKYKLRALLDADGNGKWSTGNFHRRIQPEKVIEYKDVLEIHAGWDVDLENIWDLK